MHIHILGICGTFMGGLAALAREAGHRVTGCDANVYPPMSDQLRSLDIELVEGFDAAQMAFKPDQFVIGNVVTRGNPLLEAILDAGAGYTSGGKTGTAQAVGLKAGEKYSSLKADEQKRDHSLYVAFAPVENPTIALALIVENAGWGSTSAAPIARRVFDYWLLGQYPSEEDLAAVKKGEATAPVGKPRVASEIPWPR